MNYVNHFSIDIRREEMLIKYIIRKEDDVI